MLIEIIKWTRKANDEGLDLYDYVNPLTGSNRIFTREDVGAMSSKEFAKYEKEIDAQLKAMGGIMPTNDELRREAAYGRGVVHVNSYVRADGTNVRDYYRSKSRA